VLTCLRQKIVVDNLPRLAYNAPTRLERVANAEKSGIGRRARFSSSHLSDELIFYCRFDLFNNFLDAFRIHSDVHIRL
jgi:hypothetical protein